MANFEGAIAPTKDTIGAVGDIYLNTTTGQEFKCIGVYTTSDTDTDDIPNETVKKYDWQPVGKTGSGTGGVSSWNDLTDRPFYEESEIFLNQTINFADGEATWTSSFDKEISVGSEYIVNWKGSEYKCIGKQFEYAGMNMYYIGNCYVLASQIGLQGIEYTGEPFLIGLNNGEIAVNAFDGSDSFVLNIVKNSIKRLDSKFIDAEWIAKEEVATTDTLEWDGNTEEKVSVDMSGDGSMLYFMCDVPDGLTKDDLVGSTGVLSFVGTVEGMDRTYINEEIEYILTSDDVEDLAETGAPFSMFMLNFVPESNRGVVVIVPNDLTVAETGMLDIKRGIYFSKYGDNSNYAFIKSLKFTKPILELTTIKKLPNKFIDADWIAKEEVEEIVGFEGVLSAGHEYIRSESSPYPMANLFGSELVTVIYDDEIYEIVPEEESLGNVKTLLIGEGSISGIDSNSPYPFYVMCSMSDEGGMFAIGRKDYSVDNTIKIYRTKNSIDPLPEKFLPELTSFTMISSSGKKFKVTIDDTGAFVSTAI